MAAMSVTGKARGFTLLELMVVLAILVLLTAVWPLAAPHLFPAQGLRNESVRLASALREARTTARITGRPQSLQMTQGNPGYHIESVSFTLPTDLHLSMANAAAEPLTQITFYSDGSATAAIATLTRETHSARIRVRGVTGRVERIE
jgi:type II secretion system protein H